MKHHYQRIDNHYYCNIPLHNKTVHVEHVHEN